MPHSLCSRSYRSSYPTGIRVWRQPSLRFSDGTKEKPENSHPIISYFSASKSGGVRCPTRGRGPFPRADGRVAEFYRGNPHKKKSTTPALATALINPSHVSPSRVDTSITALRPTRANPHMCCNALHTCTHPCHVCNYNHTHSHIYIMHHWVHIHNSYIHI